MVTQSSSKCKTRIRRVDPWRQQHSRINLTNYVFELIVRTPKKSFENVSKRKNEYTRLTRLGVRGYLTRHYRTFHSLRIGPQGRDPEAKSERRVLVKIPTGIRTLRRSGLIGLQ
jgi:hypothetical protein